MKDPAQGAEPIPRRGTDKPVLRVDAAPYHPTSGPVAQVSYGARGAHNLLGPILRQRARCYNSARPTAGCGIGHACHGGRQTAGSACLWAAGASSSGPIHAAVGSIKQEQVQIRTRAAARAGSTWQWTKPGLDAQGKAPGLQGLRKLHTRRPTYSALDAGQLVSGAARILSYTMFRRSRVGRGNRPTALQPRQEAAL